MSCRPTSRGPRGSGPVRTAAVAAALVAAAAGTAAAAQTAPETAVLRCGRGPTEVRFELDLRTRAAAALYPDGARRSGTFTRSETRYVIDLPNRDGATVARWTIDRTSGRGAVAPRVSLASGAFHDAPIPVTCSPGGARR
jgi:hypothetical protein